jgi:hypothetical protein
MKPCIENVFSERQGLFRFQIGNVKMGAGNWGLAIPWHVTLLIGIIS